MSVFPDGTTIDCVSGQATRLMIPEICDVTLESFILALAQDRPGNKGCDAMIDYILALALRKWPAIGRFEP